jgi:hypothetical protein
MIDHSKREEFIDRAATMIYAAYLGVRESLNIEDLENAPSREEQAICAYESAEILWEEKVDRSRRKGQGHLSKKLSGDG